MFYLTVRLCSRQGLNFGMHLKDGMPLALGLMMSCKLAEEEGNQSWNVQTMEGTSYPSTEIWCPPRKVIIWFWFLGLIWILGTLSERPMGMAPQGPIVAYPKIVEPWREIGQGAKSSIKDDTGLNKIRKWFSIQGSAKRRGLGCVNSLPGSAWL